MSADIASVRDMARQLVRDLDRCIDHSHDLPKVLGDSAKGHCGARTAIYLPGRDLEHARMLAVLLAQEVDVDRDSTLVPVYELLETLDRIRVLARATVPDFGIFCRDVDRVSGVVRSYLKAQVSVHGNDDAGRPNHTAVSLVRYAARVVPIGHRCRYDEEFRADLIELARDRGRWVQIGYAIRVLARGLSLRRSLRGVVHERVESR